MKTSIFITLALPAALLITSCTRNEPRVVEPVAKKSQTIGTSTSRKTAQTANNDATSQQNRQQQAETRGTAGEVPIVITRRDDLLGNPDRYFGKSIVVRGMVAERISDHAFTMAPNPNRQETLLVVIPSDLRAPLADEKVEVLGRLDSFDRASLQDQYGLDLPSDVFEGYQGEPVLIADSIKPYESVMH